MISRFIPPRAPRYALCADDCASITLVRLKDPKTLKNAEIINLSESGALCRLSGTFSIEINDVFLFEFKIPGQLETVVWKGRIARLQSGAEGIEVGIQFLNLPALFLEELRFGLRRRFNERQVDHHVSALSQYVTSSKFKSAGRVALCCVFLLLLFAYIYQRYETAPVANEETLHFFDKEVERLPSSQN